MKIIKEYNTFRKRTNYTTDEWFKAINSNDRHRVTMMLNDGYDVNTQSSYLDTALHVAAYNNYIKMSEILFTQKDLDVNIQNIDGHTPLMIAALYGNLEIFNLIIKNPDVNLRIKDNSGYNFINITQVKWLRDPSLQLAILQKAPDLITTLKKKSIQIHPDIISKFPHLITGIDLNLL